MKQKRRPVRLFAFLMVFLLLFPLSACTPADTTAQPYEAYVPLLSGFGGMTLPWAGLVDELLIGASNEEEPDMPLLKTFSVGGTLYFAYHEDGYFYKSFFGDKTFLVDKDTTLIEYQDNRVDPAAAGALSLDACIEIAKEFLSKMMDTKPYTVTAETEKETGAYDIRFVQYAGEFPTGDMATFIINRAGEISQYNQSGLGAITSAVVADFDKERAEQAVAAVMDRIIENSEQHTQAEYEIQMHSSLGVNKTTGQFCFSCVVDLVWHAEDGLERTGFYTFIIPV